MMAFDRTPSRPTLEPETLAALTAALSASVERGNPADELRELLYSASREAREKGIQAERLLLILKEIWYSLPAVSAAPSSAEEQALLQELISRCIQQYYAE